MRFVLNRLPVATPLKPEIHPENTDRFILGRFVEVAASLEHAYVESNPKIVVGISGPRVRDNLAWFRATLGVEIVLFGVSTKAS
jgi:hypothetical protein